MEKVLVDTSVWIDFSRHTLFRNELNFLAEEGQLTTCGLVKAEFLPFVRKDVEYWQDYFEGMTCVDWENKWWNEAIGYQKAILKSKLSSLTIPDLLILTTCLQRGFTLFTQDDAFYQVQRIFDLKLFAPFS